MTGVLSPDVSDRERISAEGYSITENEQAYLRYLCDGPKRPMEVAVALSGDRGTHCAETVADRLAYLTAYAGTEHLVKRHGDVFALTDDGRAIFC